MYNVTFNAVHRKYTCRLVAEQMIQLCFLNDLSEINSISFYQRLTSVPPQSLVPLPLYHYMQGAGEGGVLFR